MSSALVKDHPLPESPVLAVTAGDPAGIGPEICLQLLQVMQGQDSTAVESCVPLLFGDRVVFERLTDTAAGQKFRPLFTALPCLSWEEFQQQAGRLTAPALIDMQAITSDQLFPGQVQAAHGHAAYVYLERAIEQALAGRVDAIVTAPLNKEALQAAGYPYPGHTEILTEKTRAVESVMMLTAPEITCSLVTAHVGLQEVPQLLSREVILKTILVTAEAMRKIRGQEPRLVVCGLNPHAGEHGLFGQNEEERFIVPAVLQAQQAGVQVIGPLPPDTAFMPRRRQQTDAYVCMYHDQGLIPLKALAFDEAVNITLGLPIIRTSVDHGTAFDIAWQGKAAVSSLIQAINLACRLARTEKQEHRG